MARRDAMRYLGAAAFDLLAACMAVKRGEPNAISKVNAAIDKALPFGKDSIADLTAVADDKG